MLLGIHILSGILRKPKTEIISMRVGKRMEEEIHGFCFLCDIEIGC